MLETVKQAIHDSPCISFGEYYQGYVMDVMDKCIDAELESAYRHNVMTPANINRLIDKIVEELAQI